MAKAVRFKVRCNICNEIFQNGYVERHTKSKHKDLYQCGRCAPTVIILEDVQTPNYPCICVHFKKKHFLHLNLSLPVGDLSLCVGEFLAPPLITKQ